MTIRLSRMPWSRGTAIVRNPIIIASQIESGEVQVMIFKPCEHHPNPQEAIVSVLSSIVESTARGLGIPREGLINMLRHHEETVLVDLLRKSRG